MDQTREAQPKLKTVLDRLLFGTVRRKIILPFLILTLVVAAGGSFIVMRVLTANVQDRITTQLVESARAATDTFVAWEERQLEVLRLAVFTRGVPEALRDEQPDALEATFSVLAANQNVYMFFGTDPTGTVIGDVTQTDEGYVTNRLRQQDFSRLPMIAPVLEAAVDERGDKYAGVVQIDETLVLLTAAPVYDETGAFVGTVVVGTPVQTILTSTKRETLADLTLYQSDGEALETTLPGAGEDPPSILDITPADYDEALFNPTEENSLRELDLNQRTYQTLLVPLQVRDDVLGVIGVSLPPTILTTVVTTNRLGLSAIFSLAAIAVVVVGLLISQSLVTPIQRLTEAAGHVQQGDFSRVSGVRTADEIGFLGITFDEMTRRIATQTEELQVAYYQQERESAFLSAVLTSAADGIVVISLEGDVIRLNPGAAQLMNTDEALWQGIFATLIARLEDEGAEPRLRVESEGKWFEVLANRVTSTEGEHLGYVMALRDVSDQVLSERMRTSFITQISHELRTPLAAIKGFTDLSMNAAQNPQVTEYLGYSLENVAILGAIVDQILDVTALTSGSAEMEQAPLDVVDVVVEVSQAMLGEFAERDFVLDLGETDALPMVGDREKLAWALREMLENAALFTLPGDRVTVSLTPGPEQAVLTIADTGVGIEPGAIDSIFDQFYRGFPQKPDGTYIEERGAGLGLFIAQQVVAAHKGRIEVESAVHEGTTFTIYLPVSAAQRTPTPAPKAPGS